MNNTVTNQNSSQTYRGARRGRTAQEIHWPRRPFKVNDVAEREGLSRPVIYARLGALIAEGHAKKIRREKINHTPGRAVGIYQVFGL